MDSAYSYIDNGNSGIQTPEFPVISISNRFLAAVICPPDPQRGYYRGTRFDWGGVIRDLRFHGHRYFDEWFAVHDPLRHDSICGPVDEFTQIGYEQVGIGQEFLKIGVGALRKTSDEPYDRFRLYEVVDAGERELHIGSEFIEFRHRLLNGRYGYDYRKVLRLSDDRPGFRLEYSLQNLGLESLVGALYNHNFFTIDNMTTGAETEIRFPFRPAGNWREAYACVALTGNGFEFNRNLRAGESVFMGDLHGDNPDMRGYGFEIYNRMSGAGVRVVGSGRLSHMVFWACATTPCVEPYTGLQVLPGATELWSIDYELFEQ